MPELKKRKVIKAGIKKLRNAKANKSNNNPITVATLRLPAS